MNLGCGVLTANGDDPARHPKLGKGIQGKGIQGKGIQGKGMKGQGNALSFVFSIPIPLPPIPLPLHSFAPSPPLAPLPVLSTDEVTGQVLFRRLFA
jgi:hypothetical protein